MKRIGMTLIAVALLAYGTWVAAETTVDAIRRDAPKGITDVFYACVDKADDNTVDQAACLTQERARQDHRLNKSYDALVGKLDGDEKESLIEAERAWLKFRDSSVQLEDKLYGREEVDNLQLSQNEVFMICRRANELENYLALASGL